MGCAAAVETSSRKAEAVQEATVNLANERLTVVYDAALAQENEVLADVRQQVKRGGYKIPTLTLTLPITGMTCTNCAGTVERALRETEGVVYASVNFATEKAHVEYVSGVGARAPIVEAVRKAGYDVVGTDASRADRPPPDGSQEPADSSAPAPNTETFEDVEAAARAAAVRHEYIRLAVGLVFSLPAGCDQHGGGISGLLGAWVHGGWVNWLLFALADAGAVLRGDGTILSARSGVCVCAAPIWTCWWRWALRRRICSAWRF